MRAFAFMLLATLVTGCPGDDDGDGSNYVAVDDIEAAYKDAYCTYLASCGVFPDKATCLSAELNISGFAVDANTAAAVGAGRVIYNGSNVKACFDALAARSCDETDMSQRVMPPECRNFIRGTLEAGESCTLDAECMSGACSGGASEESCVMGLCVGGTPPSNEPAAIGEPCGSFNGCVVGAYCDTLDNTCVELKPMGSACDQDLECAYGLGCTGTTGARTCNSLPALGQSCATDFVCRDEGTYCDSTTTTCTQLGGPGATCSSSSQCSPYYPCNFSTSQCTRGPGIGQPCSSSARCFDAGTFCDFNTSMCAALKSNGMPCDSDTECASDMCVFDPVSSLGTCSMPTLCF